MLEAMTGLAQTGGGLMLADFLGTATSYLLMFVGFSLVIFVHELGHFIAAKLCNVRVDKFAVGFGRELFGFTRGETRYSFNALPLGGYVKMLGQEDFTIDKSGEWKVKDDPRAFTNKPVAQRMFIVSAGVFMNLVFAAVTFAAVFMMGWRTIPAQIGQIIPGMPADQAGLRVGDRITRINGKPISDHPDLQAAIILSDPDEQLHIEFQRLDAMTGDWKDEKVSLTPEVSADGSRLQIGVSPPRTNEIALVINEPDRPAEEQLQTGDRIVAVNGTPTDNFYQIQDLLADLKGDWATLTVKRPVGNPSTNQIEPSDEQPGETRELTVQWRARQYFLPTDRDQSGHLLGFVPRQRVLQALEGQRAEAAGIRSGDVIARFGGQVAPRLDEINKIRRESPERDIRVTVYRPGEGEKNLVLRPKRTGLFGWGAPTDGLLLSSQENDQLVVADIITNVTKDIRTPAAALKDVMPRGALITKVNDQPVTTWNELTNHFLKLAGQDVKITWTYQGGKEQSGTIHVPHSIGTTFELPGARQILSINGVTRKEIEENGRRVTIPVDNWRAASAVLRDLVEQGVTETTVVYRDSRTAEPQTVTIPVTAEMVDTWPLRMGYVVDNMLTWHTMTVVQETNPLKASLIGMRKTWYFIEQVYMTMQRMVIDRSMSMDQVSGPVGILQMGSHFAAAGMPQLLYFLALISANLAVINFLPLPIMDGGIFVFLLIEKIKGSPLSMRIQVATQLIGLALIIGIFLYVTLQDIQKLVG
ncbi:MAG TPA: RIP metalloprotease RseP [Phycisphaerae bacterium]|nr:RIP metalloprotease RseP [Phycisphaerae bacterium]HOM52026.1 RIP metalloprotease RseP [Phycisphaerae bacterium]HOQ86213.1 RIP metalloprotease RseP [Phycisphaerae bacterium]HPP27350.1 RIP metalloprotease RseP [Phycisphaerae bacterium]HPU25762.1 RIP metalloprotease RseP [Phycisphaerae bacterium]